MENLWLQRAAYIKELLAKAHQ